MIVTLLAWMAQKFVSSMICRHPAKLQCIPGRKLQCTPGMQFHVKRYITCCLAVKFAAKYLVIFYISRAYRYDICLCSLLQSRKEDVE